MRVLLISTYDLGRQPFGLASPAAWLRRAGAEVTCIDTSRDPLRDEQVRQADLVAFYLAMHTATRLTAPLIEQVRLVNPSVRLAAYGLYAPLNAAWLRERGVTDVLGPEAEQALVDVAMQPRVTGPVVSGPEDGDVGQPHHASARPPRLAFIQPDRADLPALTRYAALQMPDGSRRTVGSTDATRGCKHLCRHCPIVPVYAGTFRVVPVDVILEDIGAQVAAGAAHITFGDPDFFNGPTHARKVVEGLAARWPDMTYDVTIKIEHLLKHADLLPLLRDTGCLFVTSAVESVDDEVLLRLLKGHTRADFARAVALCEEAGLTLSPTFVAFTPWTSPEGYLDLLTGIERLGLVDHVASIQLAIRLLVTADSALLDLDEVRTLVDPYDAASLTWPWRHRNPDVDALQREVIGTVTAMAGRPRREVFDAVVHLAATRAHGSVPERSVRPSRPVPYMTEAWYCCAEPMEMTQSL